MKLYLNPGILFDIKTLKKLLEQLCTQADVFPAPGEQAAQGHEAGGREGRRQALARDWAARLKACLDREHCEHLLTEEELGLLELLPALLARLNAESIVCQALPVTASWQETRGTDTDRQEARLVTLRLLCGHRIRLVEDSGTACTDVFPGVSLGAALVLGAFAGHGVSCEGLCGRLVAFAKVQTAEGGSAEGFLLDEEQEEAQKEEEEAAEGEERLAVDGMDEEENEGGSEKKRKRVSDEDSSEEGHRERRPRRSSPAGAKKVSKK